MEKNNKKQIFGWMMYDWANSAFFTSVVGVLIGPYLISLATAAVGENGVILGLGLFNVTAKGFPAFCTAVAVISMVVFLPVLGAIADYTNLKKSMMAVFCYAGVIASSLLFFAQGDSYIYCGVLLIISNMTFAAANVFYNAFLIDITTEDKRDRVSSRGYALGYFSGVIMLILNLLLINNAERLGISTGLAVRLSILAASLWWGLFAIITFILIKQPEKPKSIPEGQSVLRIGFSELGATLKELKRLKYTARFLIAYLMYNDGIQTVIMQSSVFLSYELFTAKGLPEDTGLLIGVFIVAQISAVVGALGFEYVAKLTGAKGAIIISLLIWIAIVLYAYAYLDTTFQAWFLGSFIGLVLGSAQALSRSLYSQMIPVGRESSFFGLYEISEKGTSWMGQLLFAIVVGATGSFRHAILALIVFFIGGIIILAFTDVNRAIKEAGNTVPEN